MRSGFDQMLSASFVFLLQVWVTCPCCSEQFFLARAAQLFVQLKTFAPEFGGYFIEMIAGVF